MLKKTIIFILTIILFLGDVSTVTVNASDNLLSNVQCGDEAFATLNKSGVLTITGNGRMWDYYG